MATTISWSNTDLVAGESRWRYSGYLGEPHSRYGGGLTGSRARLQFRGDSKAVCKGLIIRSENQPQTWKKIPISNGVEVGESIDMFLLHNTFTLRGRGHPLTYRDQ